MLHASQLGRTDIVQQAIASLKAIIEDDEEVVNMISLSREFKVDENTTAWGTPLHVAAQHGHSDVVRALLNAQANPTVVPEIGEYTGKNAYEVAEGEKILQTFHVYLFEQIAMGNNAVLSRLLDAGIAADLRDSSQIDDSLLHWAASFGNSNAVKILTNKRALVNIANNDGQTPLHIACKNANQEVISALLEVGADPTLADKNGKDCLDKCPMSEDEIAAMREKQQEAVGAAASAAAAILDQAAALTTEEDEEGDEGNGEKEGDRLPLLVLWPPVQRQFRSSTECLLLSSDEFLFLQVK